MDERNFLLIRSLKFSNEISFSAIVSFIPTGKQQGIYSPSLNKAIASPNKGA